jgi:hypothetical protein
MRTQTAAPGLTPVTAAGRDVMRAIVQDVYGSADRLRLSEIERPVIAADEVLVQVRAAGVDRGTCHLMRGEPYLVRILGFGSAGRRTASPAWTWRARSPRSAAT